MAIGPQTARRAGALLTAGAGVMDIVSALYPAIPARAELLRDVVPVHLVRGAQTATVLAGFFLILLADGLWSRRKRAMQITIVLLVASSVLNLVKGLDFEEACAAAVLAAALVGGRSAFNISSPLMPPRATFQRIAAFGMLYYCYVLTGFIILRRAIRPVPSFLGASGEPFRLLLGAPLYHYSNPQAQWFERSLAFVGGAALLLAVAQLLRPLIPRRHATPRERRVVRRLVERHGTDSLSYFALQDGRDYFFDVSGEAFLSYRLWGSVVVVGGDPVGPSSRIPGLIDSFLEFTDLNGLQPCFLGVDSRFLNVYGARGFRTLKIGEEAVIDLKDFDATTLKRKVRRALRHVAEHGVELRVYRRGELPRSVLSQMEEISRSWVDQKGGAERGFSMTLGRLPNESDADCEIMVAAEGDRVWGYLVMVPVYGSRSWSLDAMRRRPDSMNGLMEFLVIRMAETYRDRGFGSASLNFATLSNEENDIDSRALEGTRRFLFERLSSFYQLKSLYQFNSKFEPRWRSRYLAYRDVLRLPKVALAVVQSEDPFRPSSLVTLLRKQMLNFGVRAGRAPD